jgi:DNA-binding GntR family transcriptional regulator
MSAVSLSPRALYEEVAELLRQRIFRRELEPGSWIDEVKLAQEYGISRTPLREALKVLAAEGLVTMKVRRRRLRHRGLGPRPGGGVPPAGAAGKRCRRRGGQQATDAELKELQTLHASWRRGERPRPFFAVNERFHMRCWSWPATAGATRWWPTCAR